MPRADTRLCLVVAALCACLYFWSARQPAGAFFSREPPGYYGLLTAGFRHGHLYVDRAPDPRLLTLADPYDPVANAPYAIHDMTLYRGKYYLYFGVTPVLIFFWPIVALTGWYPTEPCAVATFCFLGVASGLALLRALRRRHFSAAPLWSLGAGGLCLAFAGPVLLLTVEPSFYQVPIACAFCLDMFKVLALYGALYAARRPEAWMAAASLLFGLVVGARPDYLFGGAALVLPCAWLIERNGGRPRAERNRFLLATLVPAMICGAGLALYNWLRFGSVSEFGMHYQLAGVDVRKLQLLSLDHIFTNGFEYLSRAGTWQRYFPFFAPAAGKPYGLLVYAPWCWLLLFAFGRVAFGRVAYGRAACPQAAGRSIDAESLPGALGQRALPPDGTTEGGLAPSDQRPRVLAAAIGCGLVANFVLLSAYLGTTERYLTDFFPSCLLLGGIGALVLTARLAPRRWLSRAAAPLPIVLGLFSIFVGLLIFAGRTPRSDLLLPLARLANAPTYGWERAHGIQFGDLQLDLELPAGKVDATEPLLETGSASDQRDRIQLTYLPDNQARISLFHAGIGLLEGTPFSVPANRRTSVAVRLGSLLPPFSHPIFARWTEDEYETASREVRIQVDGHDVFHAALAAYPSPAQDVRIGNVGWLGDGVEGPFTGRVLASRRLPLEPPTAAAAPASARLPVVLDVLFPADRIAGTEPLLATGEGVRSDLLSCTYDGPGRLHFALDHFGYPGIPSDSVACDFLRPHRLIVWLGSLAPEGGGESNSTVPLSRRVVVLMDGKTVFNEDALFFPAAPETIQVGVNRFGATTAQLRFTGLVLASGSAASLQVLPPLQRSGETGAVGLELAFPNGVPGSAEPLVATGVSGAGDIIYVRYIDASHVSFGFDHWGTPGLTGPPVEIDYSQKHRLALTMDALYPGGAAPSPYSGVVRVVLDGATVLDGNSSCFPTHLYEIRIGKNPLGSSTSGAAFTGRILSVVRKPPSQLLPLP